MIQDVPQGMKRDLADIKPRPQSPAIQGFHVFKQRRGKGRSPINQAMNQGMKDKGVVGAGRKP